MTVTTVMHFVADPEGTAGWWAEHFGGSVHVDEGFAWFTVDGVEVGYHPPRREQEPARGFDCCVLAGRGLRCRPTKAPCCRMRAVANGGRPIRDVAVDVLNGLGWLDR